LVTKTENLAESSITLFDKRLRDSSHSILPIKAFNENEEWFSETK
jgi:hypothetical protein